MKRTLLVMPFLLILACASIPVEDQDPCQFCPTICPEFAGCQCPEGTERVSENQCYPLPSPTPTPDGTPSPTPTPSPSPTPTPTPTPTPQPTPEPTPVPTPPPTGSCVQGPPTGITLDGFCAGSTPNCMPGGHAKNPTLSASAGSNMFWSATYFRGQPWNKIHAEDPCYPGPIETWEETVLSGDHIDANDCWSDCHNLTLFGLSFRTKNRYTACGQGLCGSGTVTVR